MSSPDDFFISANDARTASLGRLSIMKEIQAIQGQIETSIEATSLTAIVGPGSAPPVSTTMTSSITFFNAWNNPEQFQDDASKVARSQMSEVLKYFTKLGYTVKRTQQGSSNAFNWTVTW